MGDQWGRVTSGRSSENAPGKGSANTGMGGALSLRIPQFMSAIILSQCILWNFLHTVKNGEVLSLEVQ